MLKELMEVIHHYNINPNRKDTMKWEQSSCGLFTVNSLTKLVETKDVIADVIKIVWSKVAPPRAQFTQWLLAHKRNKTGSVLLRRGLLSREESVCIFCKKEIEEIGHIFSTCNHIWRLWEKIGNWWDINLVIHDDPSVNLESLPSLVPRKCDRIMWITLLYCTIWTIWNDTNAIKFNGLSLDLNLMFEKIKHRSGSWLQILQKDFHYTSNQFADCLEGIRR